MTPRCAGLLLAIASIAGPGAQAQEPGPQIVSGAGLSVPAHTLDGGGGRSTGGPYVLAGSLGQPDAEPLHPASGGGYTLVGGFLPAAAPGVAGTDPLFADSFER